MGILRSTFSFLGNGLIGLFLKLMLGLIALIFILTFIRGIIEYWQFVVATIIGTMLSPLLYRGLSDTLDMDLSDIFYFSFGDLAGAITAGSDEQNNLQKELDEKYRAALAEVKNMEQEVADIKTLRKSEKDLNKYISHERSRTTNAQRKHTGSRIKRGAKAMMQQDGFGKQLKHLRRRDDLEIDWEKYQ